MNIERLADVADASARLARLKIKLEERPDLLLEKRRRVIDDLNVLIDKEPADIDAWGWKKSKAYWFDYVTVENGRWPVHAVVRTMTKTDSGETSGAIDFYLPRKPGDAPWSELDYFDRTSAQTSDDRVLLLKIDTEEVPKIDGADTSPEQLLKQYDRLERIEASIIQLDRPGH